MAASPFHPSVDPDSVVAPRGNPVREAAGFARGAITLPSLALRRGARGDGGVVRILPGYGTGDLSTVALRGFLRSRGYLVRGWGLGMNSGDVDRFAGLVADLCRGDARQIGRPVRIVGWSMGGVIGREAARRAPDAISHVVTLGSPIVGGPKYTAVAPAFGVQGWQVDRIAQIVATRNAEPMPVPVTAIYSKQDTVVAWQACLDPNPLSPTRHVEVRGTHAELGFSPSVFRIVAQALHDGR